MTEQSITIPDAIKLALGHHQAGRLAEADQIYIQILTADPNNANALYLKGSLDFQSGDHESAVDLLTRATTLSPNQPAPRVNLASALRALGRLAEAEAACRAAITIDPNLAAAHDTLGLVLCSARLYTHAGDAHRKAITLQPDNPEYYNNLGVVLLHQNRLDQAQRELTRALDMNPNHVDAMVNLGAAHSWSGHIDDAVAMFERAIKTAPLNGRAYRQLLWLSRHERGGGHIDPMEAAAARPELPLAQKIEFLFALGKAYADTGEFDLSFERYAAGNRLNRELLKYDVSALEDAMGKIAKTYDRRFFASDQSHGGCPSDTPIFIVGMPRSGTSLVEQILSSHSQVSGAGELSVLAELVMEHGRAQHADFPECAADLDSDQIFELGQRYVDAVRERSPHTRHVIDKQTGNFLYTGLIRQALPNARIIHCIRDPLDTCVSCFTLLFGQGQEFSYDLDDLGRFYRSYRELMDHFSDVASDRVLNVRYEDVVENLERETRRMLEFLCLPWEDTCLSFHETDRTVQTASAGQVRKPLYKGSVARWKRYQKHLGPLKAALGALAENH